MHPAKLGLLPLFALAAGCASDEQAGATPPQASAAQASEEVSTRAAPMPTDRLRERLIRPVQLPPAWTDAPTGPAPRNFAIQALPMVAELYWEETRSSKGWSAYRYTIWRRDGPTHIPVQLTTLGYHATSWRDEVPDPRLSYEYRVVVDYEDHTWGVASQNFTSPALSNPTGLKAALIGPGTVALWWNPSIGAVGYRVDGPGIAPSGLFADAASALLSGVPTAAQGWQVAAIFPGNVVPLDNRPTANLSSHAVPAPGQTFLQRPAGTGSAAQAAAHYRSRANGNTFDEVLRDLAGVSRVTEASPQAIYANVTDLARWRKTQCMAWEWSLSGGIVVACWSESDSRFRSLIARDDNGTYFAQFEKQTVAGRTDWVRVDHAQFDGAGPKYVPHVCLSCHGGQYDGNRSVVVGASLLPLDPGLLQLAPGQESNLARVNEMIWEFEPNQAIRNYLLELYNATWTRGYQPPPFDSLGHPYFSQARASFVPSGWAQARDIYLGIVKPNCAMCHLALRSNIDFHSVGSFLQNKSAVYGLVCTGRSMPHAERPFRAFWTAEAGPFYLPGFMALWMGYQSCP